MPTFQEFLLKYQNAECLDLPKFSNAFPQGVERADFLLFDGAAICEVKQIETVNFPVRIQKLIGKEPENFKRDAYRAINQVLSKANDQIEETKRALRFPNAVGIVVLDHQIPKNSSILSVIDAADRKMKGGLATVHAALCLDVLNVFKDQSGRPVRICQCLHRDTIESKKAAEICQKVFDSYLATIRSPKTDVSIADAYHRWVFDKDSQFVRYEAGFTPKASS
jgi:hypothetical protein